MLTNLMPDGSVTAVFASMTVQFVESHSTDPQQRNLLQRDLMTNLFALRQFEDTYSLAGWVRGLFMRILLNSPHCPAPLAAQRESLRDVDAGQSNTATGSADTVALTPSFGNALDVASGGEPLPAPPSDQVPDSSTEVEQSASHFMFQESQARNDPLQMDVVQPGSAYPFGNVSWTNANNQSCWDYGGPNGSMSHPANLQMVAEDGEVHLDTFNYLADLGMGGFNDYGWGIPKFMNQG